MLRSYSVCHQSVLSPNLNTIRGEILRRCVLVSSSPYVILVHPG